MSSDPHVCPACEAPDQQVKERLDDGDARMNRIEAALAEVVQSLGKNTEITQQNANSTRDVVEFFETVKSAFKVLSWIGKLAIPFTWIASCGAAMYSLWVTWKTGHPPVPKL